MKQADLFENLSPKEAGFALRWRKTSLDCSAQTMGLHLQDASGNYSKAGLVRSDGAFSTVNISEWPREGVECSLSQILEDKPATKYFLSAKACQGILRRSKQRGTILPEKLRLALARDVYNGQLTGQTSATVTSATGMPNASGPKVLDLPGKKLELSENIAFNILQDPVSSEDACPMLGAKRGMGVMAIQGSMIGRKEKNGPGGSGFKDDGTSFTLTSADKHGVAYEKDKYVVRRLTPKECERLQGFPDDWTSEKSVLVPDGNEWTATGQIRKQSDGQRYKQIGNAVSVPVAKYLGEQMTEAIK